jgi:hypothetical protein
MSGQQQDPGQAPPRSSSRLWILGVVVAAIVIVVVMAEKRRAPQTDAPPTSLLPSPVPDSVMHYLTTIPATTWEQAGTTNAVPPIFVGTTGATTGKATVLYIGALYCPYCAAARWSVITALSRFGTFAGLTYSASSSQDVYPSSPTFSFFRSTYTSDFVDFQSVELRGAEPLGGSYPALESPTKEQEALIQKYDAPPYLSPQAAGGIPFMLVGGKYMWSGSPFSPGLLAGRSQAAIAATLPAGTDPAARAILANANELTAAICAATGGRPATTCSSPVVAAAMKSLPATTPR